MDATTPESLETEELSLPQAFLLLATNDRDGKSAVPVFALRTTVAGAILAELDLLGAIEIVGKHVRATGTVPKTDFQHELELIRGKSRPHTPKDWVSMLEGRAEVQRVYERMASRGILEPVGERRLGLFKSTRYPEKDHGPEAALLQKIEAALSSAPWEPAKPDAKPGAEAPYSEPDSGAPDSAPGIQPDDRAPDAELDSQSDDQAPDATPDTQSDDQALDAAPGTQPASPRAAKAPDARTAALIALLHAAGLFGKLFPAADRTRAGEMAKDYWPARAVEDELRLVRLAQEEDATL